MQHDGYQDIAIVVALVVEWFGGLESIQVVGVASTAAAVVVVVVVGRRIGDVGCCRSLVVAVVDFDNCMDK